MSPPKITSSHEDFTALLARNGEAAQQPAGESRRTTGGRRRKERRPLSSTDGRKRRGLGRTKQWPAKVTQELLDSVDDACERFDLTKAEFTERAARFYIQSLEDGSAE